MGGIIFNDDSIIGMMAWHITGYFWGLLYSVHVLRHPVQIAKLSTEDVCISYKLDRLSSAPVQVLLLFHMIYL